MFACTNIFVIQVQMTSKMKPTSGGAQKRLGQHLQDESTSSKEDVQVSTPVCITPVYQTRVVTRQQHESPQSDVGDDSTTGSSFDLSSAKSAEERPRASDLTRVDVQESIWGDTIKAKSHGFCDGVR